MNRDLLLKHFDRISDAPDSIPRFRQFILDLAVRGKLVEQDPSDECASQLLTRIEADVVRLADGTKAKRDRLDDVRADEMPFALPVNWRWVRLGDRLDLINGRAFKPTDWLPEGVPIVRIQNLNNENAPFNYCDALAVEPRHIINTGTFLISWSGTPGTSFGAFIWRRGKAALNQHIFSCFQRGEVYFDRFLQIAINGRLDEMIAKAHGGVGLQHITKGKLENLALPVPPRSEQERIVAKIDELMALCDALAVTKQEQDIWCDRFTAATLHHLNGSDSPESLRGYANFFINHLPELTARSSQIKQHRETILNLAVRGRLVSQDPGDEPARTLIDQIQKKKGEQSSKRGAKASQPETIKGGVHPFELPTGWVWVRLQQLLEAKREISYGVIKLGGEPRDGGVFTLRCSDVKPRSLDLTGVRRVSEEIERNYIRTRLKGGEILLNIRGTLGGVALVPPELNGYNVAREVAVIPVSEMLEGRYLVNVMASPYFWNAILGSLRGIAYKGLNLGLLRLFEIPLPPLAEQRRIVTRVDELMAICDRLETQLTSGQAESRRLLEAVLQETLNPTVPSVEPA